MAKGSEEVTIEGLHEHSSHGNAGSAAHDAAKCFRTGSITRHFRGCCAYFSFIASYFFHLDLCTRRGFWCVRTESPAGRDLSFCSGSHRKLRSDGDKVECLTITFGREIGHGGSSTIVLYGRQTLCLGRKRGRAHSLISQRCELPTSAQCLEAKFYREGGS